MSDLFEASGILPPDAPLADRLRPRTLDEMPWPPEAQP